MKWKELVIPYGQDPLVPSDLNHAALFQVFMLTVVNLTKDDKVKQCNFNIYPEFLQGSIVNNTGVFMISSKKEDEQVYIFYVADIPLDQFHLELSKVAHEIFDYREE